MKQATLQVQQTKFKKPKSCCPSFLLGYLICTFLLFILLIAIIFVVIPFIFKYSISIQRNIIFPTWYMEERNYANPEAFGINGVKNFYVTVNDVNNITLGCWQILPETTLSDLIPNNNYDYDKILSNQNYSVLIYLHGNGGDRSVPTEIYKILRRYFTIIACDYRSYGDSTKILLDENGIVDDIVNLYKWIKEKTKSNIYFWGHSLGTGVSLHAISNLKKSNQLPTGLVLETPFSSVTDVMEKHFILELVSWLPWFKYTFLDPMEEHGFGFKSTEYIGNVDCPIMILHAKDDNIVPYESATKLYDVAVKGRNETTQGNVTYYLFEAMGYGHMQIYGVPELPSYIKKFIKECESFQQKKKNVIL